MKAFFNIKKNLEDVAAFVHEILEDLTYKCPKPKVPRQVISSLIRALLQHKAEISKLLDKKGGDRLLDVIPLEFLVDIVELFDLKLNKKE